MGTNIGLNLTTRYPLLFSCPRNTQNTQKNLSHRNNLIRLLVTDCIFCDFCAFLRLKRLKVEGVLNIFCVLSCFLWPKRIGFVPRIFFAHEKHEMTRKSEV
jgi:hypothetical protein